MKNIEWTKIKEAHHRWQVYEEPGGFTARFARSGGKRLGPKHSVFWDSLTAKEAQRWLHNEAIFTAQRNEVAACKVCGTTKHKLLHYAYYSGHYCSAACYETLFGICLDCGQKNMTCAKNAEPNPSRPDWGGPENHICDQCHQKKHGWHVCTISMK